MSNVDTAVSNNLTPVKFNFFELKYTPFKNSPQQTTRDILHAVITFLTQSQLAGSGILIDRHEDRKKDTARPLFVTQVSTDWKEKRIKVSMALLRKGRIPKLKPAETWTLVPLEKGRGEIAEETHFFIDINTPTVIMCVEFNHNGPRMSDIEYYFRIVANDKLGLARATEITMFMDISIDKALAEFKNVLNMKVKVQPQKLSQLDPTVQGQYFTSISNLGQHVNPSFVKLEMLFESTEKDYKSSQINKKGNTMFKRILEAFNANPINMDAFENFVVKYETEDGKEDIFNLMKGKKEITVFVDPNSTSTNRAWYELIKNDFDNFMKSFK